MWPSMTGWTFQLRFGGKIAAMSLALRSARMESVSYLIIFLRLSELPTRHSVSRVNCKKPPNCPTAPM